MHLNGSSILLLLFCHSPMSYSLGPHELQHATLSLTISWNLLKLMFIESMMPSTHLILCHPPSPPAFSLFQNQGLFQLVGSSYHVAKVLEFQLQHQSFQ